MNKEQLGYIDVSEEALESFWSHNIDFVPFGIEPRKYNRAIRYMVFCKLFRYLTEGEIIPTYEIEYKLKPALVKVTEIK